MAWCSRIKETGAVTSSPKKIHCAFISDKDFCSFHIINYTIFQGNNSRLLAGETICNIYLSVGQIIHFGNCVKHQLGLGLSFS